MKRLSLLLVAVSMYGLICSCVPVAKVAAPTILDAATKITYTSSSIPGFSEGEIIEKYTITEIFEVRMSDGLYKDKPSIIYTLYKNDNLDQLICYNKSDKKDMKIIEQFKALPNDEKVKFIKKIFHNQSSRDLDLESIGFKYGLRDQIEKIPMGKYEVWIGDGYRGRQPLILFGAYKDGQCEAIHRIFKLKVGKTNEIFETKELKEYNQFKGMSLKEKKLFILDKFTNNATSNIPPFPEIKIDFGAIE